MLEFMHNRLIIAQSFGRRDWQRWIRQLRLSLKMQLLSGTKIHTSKGFCGFLEPFIGLDTREVLLPSIVQST